MSCTSYLGIFNTQEATILSRTTEMDEADYNKATAVLKEKGYETSELSEPS